MKTKFKGEAVYIVVHSTDAEGGGTPYRDTKVLSVFREELAARDFAFEFMADHTDCKRFAAKSNSHWETPFGDSIEIQAWAVREAGDAI